MGAGAVTAAAAGAAEAPAAGRAVLHRPHSALRANTWLPQPHIQSPGLKLAGSAIGRYPVLRAHRPVPEVRRATLLKRMRGAAGRSAENCGKEPSGGRCLRLRVRVPEISSTRQA